MTRWAARLILSTLAVPACLTAAIVHAEGNMPRQGHFYVSPMIGWQDFDDDSGYDSDAGPALILGYGLTDRWMVEALGMRLEPDYSLPAGKGSDKSDVVWLNMLYKFSTEGRWQPFGTFGGGRADQNFDSLDSRDDRQFNAGVGVFGKLTDRFALRGDVRAVYGEEDDSFQPFVGLGLTALLGPLASPAPSDSDGDGVIDANDRCPGTPAGRVVDASGCERDGDRDGVVDSADECPDTPRGAAVDARGCALDTDGDGVPDYRDDCPDSERGAKVDDRGCYIELEETVTINLNLEFGYNSAELRPEQYADIDKVVVFLRQYPTANAVIEGHTDSDGAADYNQSLSERRARSVRNYIVDRGGIDADRVTSVGYGESRPIASNATRDGKQRNRRVSAVVSGTERVRQR